ncbi:hypothetical protein QVD17_15893 [Tagetes erecta]|uniref:Uncharacterized protein n=1 Tax=Tagetes erecta TaxID=13708 RepID=A0AAD8KWT6_TARER|nr:hypothetical protein QVD17_15893 [Tagetes erecta]
MASQNTFLVLLLAFSLFVSTFNAIPISRNMNLIDEGSTEVSRDIHLGHENLEDNWDRRRLSRRMDISTDDYPGSSANGRHTPTP